MRTEAEYNELLQKLIDCHQEAIDFNKRQLAILDFSRRCIEMCFLVGVMFLILTTEFLWISKF
jgi:hypothetical protein